MSDLSLIEKFACSKGKNIFLGMTYNEKLIFGHTHKPLITENTANTGSWINEDSSSCEQNTYLKIENGQMSLFKWEKRKEQQIKKNE